MTSREDLCDFLGLVHTIDDGTLFECALKVAKDGPTDDLSNELDDAEDKIGILEVELKAEKENNRQLREEYDKLLKRSKQAEEMLNNV